jgi:hypothetical protein
MLEERRNAQTLDTVNFNEKIRDCERKWRTYKLSCTNKNCGIIRSWQLLSGELIGTQGKLG